MIFISASKDQDHNDGYVSKIMNKIDETKNEIKQEFENPSHTYGGGTNIVPIKGPKREPTLGDRISTGIQHGAVIGGIALCGIGVGIGSIASLAAIPFISIYHFIAKATDSKSNSSSSANGNSKSKIYPDFKKFDDAESKNTDSFDITMKKIEIAAKRSEENETAQQLEAEKNKTNPSS